MLFSSDGGMERANFIEELNKRKADIPLSPSCGHWVWPLVQDRLVQLAYSIYYPSMTTYSIIVFREEANPPDVSRSDIINIAALWDLVEGVAKLALARYPMADRVIAVDEGGVTCGEWRA